MYVFKDCDNVTLNVDIGSVTEIYVIGTNTITMGSAVTISGSNLSIYIQDDSSLEIDKTYGSDSAYTFFTSGNLSVIGHDSDSRISFTCSGEDYNNYAVALKSNSELMISNVTVSYEYGEEFVTENETISAANTNGFGYARMCHKLFAEANVMTISDSMVNVYGAYWAINCKGLAIRGSDVDIIACDVAISVHSGYNDNATPRTFTVTDSQVNCGTIWTKSWSDGNGNKVGEGNHIPCGISIGSPGAGDSLNDITVTFDSNSTVTTQGLRFFNYLGTYGGLVNNGTLDVEASTFAGYDNGTWAGYGILSQALDPDANKHVGSSFFNITNNGSAEINAPVYMDSDGETNQVSTFENTRGSTVVLNSTIISDKGTGTFVNNGSVKYGKDASGLDLITGSGSVQSNTTAPPLPTWDDEDDEELAGGTAGGSNGSDDTVTIVACAAAAAVAALMAAFLILDRRP